MDVKSVRALCLLKILAVLSATAPVTALAGQAEGTALVVIDMQPYFVTRDGNADKPANQQKVAQILETQIEAIRAAERAHVPVIFLEYEGDGSTNDQLRKATSNYKDAVFFLKNTDGMLDEGNQHRKQLVDYLSKKKIQTLVITGANGGACVHDSITGALRNNLNVIAYTKGIADFNFDDFIYPYVHQYDELKPTCSSCSFRQVDEIGGVFPVAETAHPCQDHETPGKRVHELFGEISHLLGKLK